MVKRIIYWIGKTIHRDKRCNSFCPSCKFYEQCKIDGSEA